MRNKLASFRIIVSAALLLGIAACAESPSAPRAVTQVLSDASTIVGVVGIDDGTLNDPTLWFRRVWACKRGGSAELTVSVNGGSAVGYSLADGTCAMVHYNGGGVDAIDTVTVTELPSTVTVLDSIVADSTHNLVRVRLPAVIGSQSITAYTTRSKGAIVTFYNSLTPPPSGGKGCTPGYWKQSQHFDSWPAAYTPNMQFSAVFENAFPGMTLLQVLGLGGGGLNALGRHTVAALLNTGNTAVSYDLTTAGVVGAFNAVFPGGDYEKQKNIFANFNEQGCPLN